MKAQSLPRIARLPGIMILAALVVGTAAPAAEPAKDEPKPAWRNGPVRYILTQAEDKDFKALKTDEERAKAIEEFWARRDPTPGTPANEYRDDFNRRVEEANKEFKEATGPGWSTYRGRVLLVAGYPAERKPGDEGQRFAIDDGSTRDPKDQAIIEAWSYADRAKGLEAAFAAADAALAKCEKDGGAPQAADGKAARAELTRALGPAARVVFQKSESGEFSLRDGSELLNAIRKLDPLDGAMVSLPAAVLAAIKGSSAAPKPAAAAAKASGGDAPAAPGGGPAGQDAPLAVPLPAGVERLRQAALASDPKAEPAVAVSPRFYKAEDGSTRALLVLSAKKSDVTMGQDGKPRAVLYARLRSEGAPGDAPLEYFDSSRFTPYDDAGEGWVKYAFAFSLKPGNYELRVGISDGPDGKITTLAQSLVLPSYAGDALALSSLTLSRSATPAQAGGEGPEDHFRVGALKLVPWVKPVLGPKDELAFFYDVYNAKKDAASNLPALDVAYVFEKKDPAGWKKRGRLADPGKHEEALGYAIPAEVLSQWPAGDYRLTVQVKDTIANAETSSAVEFSVVK